MFVLYVHMSACVCLSLWVCLSLCVVTVTEALVLLPLLEDRGHITESIRILLPIDRMKQKCFQITTKQVCRSQQFQQLYLFMCVCICGSVRFCLFVSLYMSLYVHMSVCLYQSGWCTAVWCSNGSYLPASWSSHPLHSTGECYTSRLVSSLKYIDMIWSCHSMKVRSYKLMVE